MTHNKNYIITNKFKRSVDRDSILLSVSFLIVILSKVFLFVYRDSSVEASVFKDEYEYSLRSRLLPIDAPGLPNYLFSTIFRISNIAGANFLSAVHLLNIIFFIFSLYFLRKICILVLSRLNVALFTILAGFSPIETYSVYFTPEILFLMIFALLTLTLVKIEDPLSGKSILKISFLVSSLSLVKPGGLFILIPITIYFAFTFIYKRADSRKIPRLGYLVFWYFVTPILIKFGISYVLVGSQGISLFGETYTSVALNNEQGISKLFLLFPIATKVALNHATGFFGFFGICTMIPALYVMKTKKGIRAHKIFTNLSYFFYINLSFYIIFIAFLLLAFHPQILWSIQESTLDTMISYFLY